MRAETPAPAPSSAGAREAYLRALLRADVPAARQALEDALDAGLPVRAIYLDVLQPALYEVGRLWSQAKISVAQEHLATAATQSAMARLAESLYDAPRRARGVAMVACVSDELHAVGGRMVADFLQADGWTVVFLGPLTPGDSLAALAAERRADVVAVSAALPDRIPRVADVCAALRALDPAPYILAGGQAFEGDEDRALRAGADAFAGDAEAAVAALRERFPAG